MKTADDVDTVHKLYRQGRLWSRFNLISLGKRKNEEDENNRKQFNSVLKLFRDETLERLHGGCA